MIDLGYRSIEIHVVNHTHADLVVQAAHPVGAYSAFIAGEAPARGDLLRQFEDVVWGVMTKDLTADVLGYVSLTGLGEGAVEIDFRNQHTGVSVVEVRPNTRVGERERGEERLLFEDDHNHTIYRVRLIPLAHTPGPGK